jgi:hypothetical protein
LLKVSQFFLLAYAAKPATKYLAFLKPEAPEILGISGFLITKVKLPG